MLQDALTWLEARAASEAPSLLDDVRRVMALARPSGAPWHTNPARLDDDASALTVDDRTEELPDVGEVSLPPRYEDLGIIGVGGMGVVHRVRDRELQRVVALKRMRRAIDVPSVLARFVEEVQITAQLQHPGIVPVYDAGQLDDGQVYFTMKEVRGRTLSDVVREAHAPARLSPSGWTLRRLVTALHHASQAVAYAHARGVIHRDLKPHNVMLGAHGEVQVMDWGLCKVVGNASSAIDEVQVDQAREATRVGRILGSPAYMAPEQARGDNDRLDARTDVYALGAMLREVLTGAPPYGGATAEQVLFEILAGPPSPLTPSSGANGGFVDLPDDLVDICARATSREPDERHPAAAAFADDLLAWLDGSKRREVALELVDRAAATVPEADALRARAAALRAEAAAGLDAVPRWAPEEQKLAHWSKQDEAAALEARADLSATRRDQLLQGALTQAPDLPEAHALLAEDLRDRHAAAEVAHDHAEAARAEALLRAHVDALPEHHPIRRSAAAYLRGTGAVTLITEPEGAEVELLRYEPYGRRLVARPVGSLGRTPLVELPLERGSWLLVLRHPGHETVRYPVFVGRGAHWDGVRPGDRAAYPIALPRAGALGADDCYVPAGWFQAGAREHAGAVAAGWRWCDPFVLGRFPVTNRAYLAFLDDLVASGREEEALRFAPRERGATEDKQGAPLYGRDADGRFVLRPDPEGHLWEPEWPVFMVDWSCACAYAAWHAGRTDQPWRLPWDLEWEKAARGVDGRFRPWGDRFDASYCNMRESVATGPFPSPVDSWPIDESVYGVRGLAGNVQDWCLDRWTALGTPPGAVVAPPVDGPGERINRGGSWRGVQGHTGSSARSRGPVSLRLAGQGFRLARSWMG